MPSINIENVNLKTATIEIKALTVNGRQLTLSTFRQIPEEDIIDYDALKLNGVPWGMINYFWKGNGDEATHWHIVWQKGNELKRCCVRREVDKHNCVDSLKRQLDQQIRHRDTYMDKHIAHYNDDWKQLNIPYLADRLSQYSISLKNLKNNGDTRWHNYEANLKSNTDRVEEFTIKLHAAKHLYEVVEKEKLDDLIVKHSRLVLKLKELIQPFADLPQLFIAI